MSNNWPPADASGNSYEPDKYGASDWQPGNHGQPGGEAFGAPQYGQPAGPQGYGGTGQYGGQPDATGQFGAQPGAEQGQPGYDQTQRYEPGMFGQADPDATQHMPQLDGQFGAPGYGQPEGASGQYGGQYQYGQPGAEQGQYGGQPGQYGYGDAQYGQGYGQPGQGYGEPAPAYGAPGADQGGYPGQPGYGGPTPPGGEAPKSKLPWIIGGAAAAVVIVLAAIFIPMSLRGGGDGPEPTSTQAQEPTTTDTGPEPTQPPTTAPSPQPTQTTSPTQQPSGTAAAWADREFGTFESVTLSGSGDSVVDMPAGVKAGIITATSSGSGRYSYFSVVIRDDSGSGTDYLFTEQAPFEGTAAFGVWSYGDGTKIEVTAQGDWTLKFDPISSAPALTNNMSGSGYGVYLYDGPATTIAGTHSGSSNFIVVEYAESYPYFGLIFNEIGAYEGTKMIRSGPSVVKVEADGDWTFKIG